MARRYIKRQEELQAKPHTEDELVGLQLQKEIVNKIAMPKHEYQFNTELDLVEKDGLKTKTFSFYTYRGQVCILDDQGMDVTFDNGIHKYCLSPCCTKLKTYEKTNNKIQPMV